MKILNSPPPDRLAEILASFPRHRVAVFGDYFLDKYLEVDPALAEVSIETGKTAHQIVGVRHSPGAAGTVVANLAALGVADLVAVGFCGADGEGYELRSDLKRLGCSVDHLHLAADRRTPTYLKPRDITQPGLEGEHSRYDTKNRQPTADRLQEQLISSLDRVLPEVGAVIVADQVEEADCGVVTAKIRAALAARAARFLKVIFWADSRLRIREFRRLMIKPNQFEAIGMENPPPGAEVELAQLAAAVSVLRDRTGAPVCVTRGAAGMLVSDPELTLVPAVDLQGPIDPTGAGDSATAGTVAALLSGATLPEAALVGNLVASITIQQLATTGTASRAQVLDRFRYWQSYRR